MNSFQGAMALLVSAVDGMRSRNTKKPVGEEDVSGGKSGATRRGATHIINPSAKSKAGAVSPAEYRRLHMGKQKGE